MCSSHRLSLCEHETSKRHCARSAGVVEMGQKTYRWDRYGVMVMGVVLGADTHARSQRKFLQPENGGFSSTKHLLVQLRAETA